MSLTRASKRTARAEDSVDDALFFDVLELAGSDLVRDTMTGVRAELHAASSVQLIKTFVTSGQHGFSGVAHGPLRRPVGAQEHPVLGPLTGVAEARAVGRIRMPAGGGFSRVAARTAGQVLRSHGGSALIQLADVPLEGPDVIAHRMDERFGLRVAEHATNRCTLHEVLQLHSDLDTQSADVLLVHHPIDARLVFKCTDRHGLVH
mmetsp:Transcript_7858/g.28736  ORF Transcript_7858/g.28736 Transcript_7858/m.28736 type:complete len:205 (+) Transcript_7858:678-1292(+)